LFLFNRVKLTTVLKVGTHEFNDHFGQFDSLWFLQKMPGTDDGGMCLALRARN
jgi:hypothetical protein